VIRRGPARLYNLPREYQGANSSRMDDRSDPKSFLNPQDPIIP
jgi:hypothetical protein